MNGGLLLLTEYGREFVINTDTNISDFWCNQNYKEAFEKLQIQETPFASKHFETLNSLIKVYDEYSTNLRKYLKSLLLSMSPYKFEQLVIDVLVTTKEAPLGEVTKKVGTGVLMVYYIELYLNKEKYQFR